MTQSKNLKEEAFEKWKPIIQSLGVTGSRADWLSKYTNSHQSGILDSENVNSLYTEESFPSLLPIAKQVASKTIGLDLVSVSPIGGGNSGDEIRKIDAELKSDNRDGKIDSIIEGTEYVEKTREDHPDYIKPKGPSGALFYLDYQYGSTSSPITTSIDEDKLKRII